MLLNNLDELLKNDISPSGNDAGHLVARMMTNSPAFFTSDGQWSMHELLEALLDVMTPAKLYLSTFSITEFPARNLSTFLDKGLITELHVLLDREFPKRYPTVDQLMNGICTSIGYSAVHAKILVLETHSAIATVLGSANWTVNPRLEAGVMTTDTMTGIEFRDKIRQMINGAK